MRIQTNGDELERKEFEAWILSMPFAEQDDVLRKENGDYFHLQTHWCWKAWQASRSSLKVIIPDPRCRYADDSYKAYSRRQVEALLAELGVTIIEEDI